MGLFDNINFAASKTADSSYDLRLMDTPCDHNIRDEQPVYDLTPILTTTPYSGVSAIFNVAVESGQIDPTASILITTAFPYVNDGSFSLSQSVALDITHPIVESFVVPNPVNNFISLTYPPKTNSVSAQQVIPLDNNEITFLPFTRYNLFQLYGNIQFTNSNDIGQTILFTYYADKKKILQKNQNGSINYEFVGLNQAGQGIFRVFGQAILSTQAQIFMRYKTSLPNCPKCNATGILNDLNFDVNGRLQLVYDFSKLIQDYFKRFYTDKGSNSFDLTEGTSIPSLIGAARGDTITLESLIKAEVVNLLFQIRSKQRIQQGIQGIGLGEQISQINSIDVRAINSTDMSVRVEVTSKSGQIQQIGSVISIVGGN